MVAIGDYDDRYVIPKRHGEQPLDPYAAQGSCGIDFSGVAPEVVADPRDPVGRPDFDLRDRLVRRGGGADG